jgi:GNAT superfamily N-acetyltransferase
MDQTDDFHPKGPHWYLPLIGVDATKQGRGYGSALLRHALERCDRDGLPAQTVLRWSRYLPRQGIAARSATSRGSPWRLVPIRFVTYP